MLGAPNGSWTQTHRPVGLDSFIPSPHKMKELLTARPGNLRPKNYFPTYMLKKQEKEALKTGWGKSGGVSF